MAREKALVTGGAGFIGHHLIDYLLEKTDWDIVCLDRLDTSGNLNRLEEVLVKHDRRRFRFVFHDLKAEINELVSKQIGDPQYIFHLAASSHVDRSIVDPLSFVMDNVVGTCNVLNYARHLDKIEYVQSFSCYDSETELYTRDGWKKYSEIQVGDTVLTLDQNSKVSMQPVKKTYVQHYKGDMVRIYNNRVDLLVTPNHRMYNDKMEICRADELINYKSFNFPTPTTFSGRHDRDERLPEGNLKDVFYLIGLFIGDGFTAHQKRYNKSVSGYRRMDRPRDSAGRFMAATAQKERGVLEYSISECYRIYLDIPFESLCAEDVELCLQRLGIKYSKPKNKSGEHFYFSSKEWSDFFDKYCGKYAVNKQIPDFMLEYDSEYLDALMAGLIDSDGSYYKETSTTTSYTTVSDKLATQMVELYYKCGANAGTGKRASKESTYQGRIISPNYPAHYITACFSGKSIKPNMQTSMQQYDGIIWCVKVDNGNVLVRRNNKLVVQGNTDEVFGDARDGEAFEEWDRHFAKNPYSASKSGAESLGISFYNTYKLPIVTTNCMNVFGERQHPEKFVPLVIGKLLRNETIDIHCYPGRERAGSRFYIYSANVSDVSFYLTQKAVPGDKYNIVGQKEVSNLEIVNLIADIMGVKPQVRMVDFHSNRPGHDLRYALKDTKLGPMGYVYPFSFEESLLQTVKWTLQNQRWL